MTWEPIAILIALLWVLTIILLALPNRFWPNLWDKVTKAKYRDDRLGLEIMFDNFRSFPQDWSVSREAIHFPKEGMKQTSIMFDEKKGWSYSLNSFGGTSRPLEGHFADLFVKEIAAENSRRESQALLRQFYPNMDGPLMLGSK
jgi:hypothetical protein